MTASLSKKAIGESHRPRGKCCVSWQAEAARHAVIPVPLDTDGIKERAGLAADRVPARYLDTWARPQCQRPSYAPVDTWQRAIEDGGRFLDLWGTDAAAMRWTAGELFDVPRDGRPAGRPRLAAERRARWHPRRGSSAPHTRAHDQTTGEDMKANSTSTPRKGKGSNLSPSSETSGTSEAKAQPYVPTPIETKALAAYKAAKEGRGPRLKVTINASDAGQVEAEHPNIWVGTLALMQAIGTTDLDFFDGLMRDLVNAGTGKGERASEQGANFMLAVVKGIEPRDQIEAMLAAQMAAVHNATMTFARRLAHVDIIPQQDSAQNAFNKLARTFAAQVAALKDYRSKGEQKMTVQHVHVADGGQAVIGNVGTPAPGGGASEKMKEQPHALAYAPGAEMPREVKAERATVPSAGG